MGAALISFCLCRFTLYLVHNQADFENNPHPVQEQGFNMNMTFFAINGGANEATWTGLTDANCNDVPLGAFDPPYNGTGASYSGTPWMKQFIRITQWHTGGGLQPPTEGGGLQVTFTPGMFSSQGITVSGAQPMFLRFGFRGYTKEADVYHCPMVLSCDPNINNVVFQDTYHGCYMITGVQNVMNAGTLVRGTVGGVQTTPYGTGMLTSISVDITVTSDEGFTLGFITSGLNFITTPAIDPDPTMGLGFRVFHCTRLFED